VQDETSTPSPKKKKRGRPKKKVQDEKSTPSPLGPLFLQDSDTDTTDASSKDGDFTNEKLDKQDETTMNVDIGSKVVVSGPVPTPVTEKRNNKTMRRKVSYVDNHSW
jgi:hypothetical protein